MIEGMRKLMGGSRRKRLDLPDAQNGKISIELERDDLTALLRLSRAAAGDTACGDRSNEKASVALHQAARDAGYVFIPRESGDSPESTALRARNSGTVPFRKS